jgi:hypothetical protein
MRTSISLMSYMEAMMYQRRAKMKPAAMNDIDRINTMSLTKFFKAAKEDLERRGLEDEAHRFEMLEYYFRNKHRGSSLAYEGHMIGL